MSRPFDHSDYITAMTADQLLNSSIVTADIREGFEEYLDIFDRFYAADVEVRSEGSKDTVIGKAAVLSRLSAFV